VDGCGGGDAQVEDEQGHGDGEEAVTESGEAFDALSGNAVVERVHRKEFSGWWENYQGPGTVQIWVGCEEEVELLIQSAHVGS
jgi:hypothetical protein